MYLFGIILRWASTGYNNTWQSLILPCLVISIPKIGWISMHLYSNLYKELREDYIKYLYSNGIEKICSIITTPVISSNRSIPVKGIIGKKAFFNI